MIFAEDDNLDSANDQLTRLKRSLARKRNWRRSQRMPTYLTKQEYTFVILMERGKYLFFGIFITDPVEQDSLEIINFFWIGLRVS